MRRRDRGSTTGPPRWVKVLGVLAALLALLIVGLLLFSGGEHGPGRHLSTGQVGAPPLGDGGGGDLPRPPLGE